MGERGRPVEGMGIAPHFWQGRRVLVTGHTGFKGAWLSLWLQTMGAEVSGISLRPEADGAYEAMGPWGELASHEVDVRDEESLKKVLEESRPEIVFHLAAQSLVHRGLLDPTGTYATNVMGTLNVLRATRLCPSVRVLVVVTSDKVYRNDGSGRPFVESDPLGGEDPYSNSKALCDLLTSGWGRRLLDDAGIRSVCVRSGNVIGGGDRAADRLLTDVFRSLADGTPIGLRNPASRRPWQFVLEPLRGYLVTAQRLSEDLGDVPDALNFGPDQNHNASVLEVVEQVVELWGEGSWIKVEAGFSEAPSLQLDARLAEDVLGWRPVMDLPTALAWTVDWQRAHLSGANMRAFTRGQIKAYEGLG